MFDHIFCRTTPEKVREAQLREAQLQLLEHEKAAEYHSAIAGMLRARIERLTPPPIVVRPSQADAAWRAKFASALHGEAS